MRVNGGQAMPGCQFDDQLAMDIGGGSRQHN
jgi:hypothetical protein